MVLVIYVLGVRAIGQSPLREGTLPIPFLRPFDSAHVKAHLRQGERNSPPFLDSGSGAGMMVGWG